MIYLIGLVEEDLFLKIRQIFLLISIGKFLICSLHFPDYFLICILVISSKI